MSAAFSDIDECAENTGNCAGIGGDCRNTTGSFLCEFASACEDAQWTSVESVFPDGPRRICLVPVTDHRTNRKHPGCTPYEISVSAFPSCSDIFGYPPVFPDSGDLQAGESYAFNCGEGEKQSADKKSCACPPGRERHDGTCVEFVSVLFPSPANGTISARSAGISIQSGAETPRGATVAFTVASNDGWQISAWTGDCAGAAGGACTIAATVNVSVGAAFSDIDECQIGAHDCLAASLGGRCINTPGAFSCGCAPGYQDIGGRRCVDVNECDAPDACAGRLYSFCNNAVGGFSCDCPSDRVLDQDRNACACNEENYPYGGDPVIPECPGPHISPEQLHNACQDAGWTLTLHVDPDPVFDGLPLGCLIPIRDATTGNSHDNCSYFGSTANCEKLFDLDNYPMTINHNEGDRYVYNCPKPQIRSDDLKSCVCPSGYQDDGSGGCRDINECAADPNRCGIRAACVNVPGDYQCACVSGAVPTALSPKDLQCADINECDLNLHNCAPVGGRCDNISGGFACSCAPGYNGDGLLCGTDRTVRFQANDRRGTIFAAGAGAAIHNGGAVAFLTSVTLAVEPNDGWRVSVWTGHCAETTGDSCEVAATVNVSVGVIFADIDECAANTHDCAEIGGACQNTRGSFLCEFRDNCRSAGWGGTAAINNNEDWHLCNIPLQNVADGREHPKCALYPAGSNSIPSCLDVFGVPPDFPPEADHQAGQRYVYNCVKPKIQSDDRKRCVCPPQRPEKNDGTCLPLVTVSFLPPDNGTLSAENDDGPVHNGDIILPGTTVTFIAAPNNGWQFFIWLGDCARIIRDSCAVEAAANVSVGVLFYDINECATNEHDCAPVGGDCGNTEGGFTCSCLPGYSGDGKTCNADKTVSFLPPDNGTLSAENDGGPVHNGDIILHGTAVTFAATPNSRWQISIWTGHCAGTTGASCAVEATMNVSVGVAFSDINECATNKHDCAPIGGDCDNTLGGFTCSCVSGYSGDGKICNTDKTVSFLPPDNGTLSAENDDGPVHNGDIILHGTAVTFAATPNSGWQVSIWTGHCAGTTGGSCPVEAAMNVSVGVAFSDINECATNKHDCAPVGGDCDNTLGGFTCSCLPGYSGDGKICNTDKTVSFLPPDNGTLSAENDGGPVHNGDIILHGTAVTFAATPNSGWQVSIWTGHCAGTTGGSCPVEAAMNVSVGVAFSDINECATNAHDCAPVGGDCDNTLGGFTCSCLSGYSGDGKICNTDKTVSFLPPDNGTLSAENDGGPVHNGDIILHGTAVTFAAAPNSGWQISIWTGHCAGTTGDSCAVEAAMNVSVGVAFSDINECATNAHDCAPVGGDCGNTLGGFTCSCLSGYSGDGKICNTDKTVSFLPPDNGTLSAENDGGPVHNGDIIAHGTTVTFAATPNSGWQISIWTGHCAGTTGGSCPVEATMNVSVGVAFSDINECATNAHDCAPVGGDCDNTLGGFTCSCLPGYSGDGKICNTDKTVSFLPPDNGTLSAENDGGPVHNGDIILHGTAVTFAAAPNSGWQISIWTGHCAGTTGGSCPVEAAMNVSVGVAFSDINECATNAHDCAPVGGDCDNTLGGFTCSCLPGYSGDGKTCYTDKNIEIFPSSNGTIFAGALADSLSGQIVRSTVRNGENVAHGTTIRFRALPDANGPGFDFYVRQWTGDCAALLTAPSSDRALSLTEQTCELTANQNLRVGAIFGRAWRVSLSTPPNGTVSARIKDGDPLTPARNAVPHRTTVIYTARPGRGHYISGWEPGKPGRCDQQYQKTDIKSADPRECETVVNSPLFRTSSPAPIISPLPCLAIPGARHAAMDACECETDGHLIFGAPPGLFCASPTICPQNYAGDDCLPPAPDASAPLPQAANAPDACRSIFGGRIQTAENSQTVCSGVDHNDTFCIIGSRDAFPCRGLFNHIWKCNQTNRPALNPFFCGAPCADGDNASRGRHCGKKSVADDTFN